MCRCARIRVRKDELAVLCLIHASPCLLGLYVLSATHLCPDALWCDDFIACQSYVLS